MKDILWDDSNYWAKIKVHREQMHLPPQMGMNPFISPY